MTLLVAWLLGCLVAWLLGCLVAWLLGWLLLLLLLCVYGIRGAGGAWCHVPSPPPRVHAWSQNAWVALMCAVHVRVCACVCVCLCACVCVTEQGEFVAKCPPSHQPFMNVFFETQVCSQLREAVESQEPDRVSRVFAAALREWRQGHGLELARRSKDAADATESLGSGGSGGGANSAGAGGGAGAGSGTPDGGSAHASSTPGAFRGTSLHFIGTPERALRFRALLPAAFGAMVSLHAVRAQPAAAAAAAAASSSSPSSSTAPRLAGGDGSRAAASGRGVGGVGGSAPPPPLSKAMSSLSPSLSRPFAASSRWCVPSLDRRLFPAVQALHVAASKASASPASWSALVDRYSNSSLLTSTLLSSRGQARDPCMGAAARRGWCCVGVLVVVVVVVVVVVGGGGGGGGGVAFLLRVYAHVPDVELLHY